MEACHLAKPEDKCQTTSSSTSGGEFLMTFEHEDAFSASAALTRQPLIAPCVTLNPNEFLGQTACSEQRGSQDPSCQVVDLFRKLAR